MYAFYFSCLLVLDSTSSTMLNVNSESNPNIAQGIKGNYALTGEFGEMQKLWLHCCHPLRIPSLHRFLAPQVSNTLKSLAPRKLHSHVAPLPPKSVPSHSLILPTKPTVFENDIWKVTSNGQIQSSLTFSNNYHLQTHVSRSMLSVSHTSFNVCDHLFLTTMLQGKLLSINTGKIRVICLR